MRQENRSVSPRSIRAAPVLIAALIVAAAVALTLSRNLSERPLATGAARWIWFSLDIRKPGPLRFYAQRDFRLEAVPASAKARRTWARST